MNLAKIPKELTSLNQWVCTKGDSKVPMRAFEPRAASSTDPRSWSSFDTATKAVSDGHYDHIGFVFDDNDIVGIDIDDGYDEDGLLSALAADIICSCESYTEKSKSGRGFHILLKGTLPFKGKNNLNGVEIYKQSRYFIMTGNVIVYDTIIENQEAIDYIVAKYFPETRESISNKVYDARIYTPAWDNPIVDGRIKLRPMYHPIPDGTRNISLTSLAGQWHNAGYTAKDIYNELLHVNNIACKPPLHESEIQAIVMSVTRYKR